MGDYIDAQRRANEFNAQADDARIARLERGLAVMAQVVGCLVENEFDYQNAVFRADNDRHHKFHKGYLIMLEILADLTLPPTGERGERSEQEE
uniref:Uncharacterized protein n=1 Tax=viral metagenome TaxID=1070528 RepID=A0A6M3JFK3_9ZZZZ